MYKEASEPTTFSTSDSAGGGGNEKLASRGTMWRRSPGLTFTLWALVNILLYTFFLAPLRRLPSYHDAPTTLPPTPIPTPSPTPNQTFESCAWDTLEHHVSLLDVAPIPRIEYLQRQFLLAFKLALDGVDALVMEPSASSLYFANVSASFGLSERPFLMIIDKHGKLTYLAPQFELSRIAELDIVHDEVQVIGWADAESPYEVLRGETGYKTIVLDEQVRFMVAVGLQSAGFNVLPASQSIQSLRAVKSRAEIAILRRINEYTLQLVRSLQRCIRVGMTQEMIREAASSLFTRAGLHKGWALVLFGEQAAHPHGGSSKKTLGDGEFVLIDIGSTLHGYGSDVTRTILPEGSTASEELMTVWNLVLAAQSAAIARMNEGEMCSDVDEASRSVIREAGFADFFTHRLGHGLGLEVHEHPYLNGANNEMLKLGEVVTNEPGIYVTSEQAKARGRAAGFGVRIEDAIHVSDGGGVLLTGSRAVSPHEP